MLVLKAYSLQLRRPQLVCTFHWILQANRTLWFEKLRRKHLSFMVDMPTRLAQRALSLHSLTQLAAGYTLSKRLVGSQKGKVRALIPITPTVPLCLMCVWAILCSLRGIYQWPTTTSVMYPAVMRMAINWLLITFCAQSQWRCTHTHTLTHRCIVYVPCI